jgi:tRNA pseudouridine55 synthase
MSEALEGFLVLDKPSGITSFGCVARVRRILQEKRVGHCGTLDPMARGVLIVLVGRACREQERFLGLEKQYWFRAEFGRQTSTGDREGELLLEKACDRVTEATLKETLVEFTGQLSQIPPRYSALKYQGKPYYEYARKGQEIPRKARPVSVREFSLLSLTLPHWEARVTCSRGTYIRALVEDVAARLDTVATLTELIRERVGLFLNSQAIPWTQLGVSNRDTLARRLVPVEEAFKDLAHA